ncbi:tRNA (N(6)-L-threonylcarbamoyladenosine(37)-C(2))-methylthiotransferase MtaB [bacterium]|nr:tRNA (N(6)-L-threonylcarbamoyladenosine(37)-C(2))-methylthiotransferase MtaB [bacterium]
MTLLRVAFKTLGCKLNQLETESVADVFAAAGAAIGPFEAEADLYVVNTCTVTSKAEQKARRVMRQALASNSDAVVLVTGCYAQMDPEGLALVQPRTLVLPGEEKAALLSLASWLQENWQGHGDLFDAVAEWRQTLEPAAGDLPRPDPFAYHPLTFAFHSRPSLKIQDGCDNRCAYCRVCLARGPSVSLPAERLLGRVRELERSGKAEVVLTGINLAQYRDGAMRFPGLLAHLTANTERIRFRISSWEPEHVDAAFLEAFAHPRVQPHVHLSVQSGSSAVLRRMARPYAAERVLEAIAALRAAKADPFVAADLIAGFPGETDAEFAETLAFCARADFAWIHAFPFSARPGTRAWDMRPKVPERVAGERVAALSAIAKAGKARYVARQTGRLVAVILEKGGNPGLDDEVSPLEASGPDAPTLSGEGRAGTSSNYLKVWVEGVPPDLPPGTSVEAVLKGGSSLPGIDASAALAAP